MVCRLLGRTGSPVFSGICLSFPKEAMSVDIRNVGVLQVGLVNLCIWVEKNPVLANQLAGFVGTIGRERLCLGIEAGD